ncbi:GDSL esterase/lipase At4g01130-like [Silene latifolia]|uniref:GDSL esterase/lipase At4g01130-like n=1 Tax=Silene latifolia TaxID=37657 RepID=UPI003D77D8E1
MEQTRQQHHPRTVRLPRVPTSSLFVTGVSPFSLDIHLNQMKELRSKAIELQSHSAHNNVSNPLPPVSIFGKALYIGQNNFAGNLADLGISGVMQFILGTIWHRRQNILGAEASTNQIIIRC